MRTVLTLLRTALRAAVWMRTPIGAIECRLGHLLGSCLVLIAIWFAIVFLETKPEGRAFNVHGLNAMVAWIALCLAVKAVFVPPERRLAFLTIGTMLSWGTTVVMTAVVFLIEPYSVAFVGESFFRWVLVWVLLLGIQGIWVIGAWSRIIMSLQPDMSRHLGRAALMWGASLILLVAFPHYPMFVSRDYTVATANTWEYVRASLRETDDDSDASPSRIDTARVELSQPALMERAIAQLAPQQEGVTDVYAIGVAGWSQQDVFIRELSGAFYAIDKALPIEKRAIQLVNHHSTVGEWPIANRQNFAAAVRAAGRVMNKDEDVLLIFLTSHGSRDGVALALPSSIYAMLAPAEVAAVLDREGIKNRILIVSACYSGVFIAPLANENTIILTAADENSASFGCSNDREWTYFGDALFNRSLTPGKNFERAFHDARSLIGVWEATEGVKASNPQAHFGANLLHRLESVHVAGPDNDAGSQRRAEAQQ